MFSRFDSIFRNEHITRQSMIQIFSSLVAISDNRRLQYCQRVSNCSFFTLTWTALLENNCFFSVKNTKTPEQSPRSGFFYNFKKKEVLIRRWDEEKGCPVPVDSLTEENLQLPENLKNLDKNLGAYPYESYKQWCGLSNFITAPLIDQLQPKSGRIDSVVNFTPDVDENNRTKVDREGLPILHRDETDRFGFADIGRRWWPSDCTAQERTEYAQKSDWIFNHLKEERGVAALKGEFQFAYLTFILGQVSNSI